MEVTELVIGKLNKSFSLGENGVLRYKGRLCVPNIDGLRNRILEEAHGSPYSIHPVQQKCIMTLEKYFCWKVSKRT